MPFWSKPIEKKFITRKIHPWLKNTYYKKYAFINYQQLLLKNLSKIFNNNLDILTNVTKFQATPWNYTRRKQISKSTAWSFVSTATSQFHPYECYYPEKAAKLQRRGANATTQNRRTSIWLPLLRFLTRRQRHRLRGNIPLIAMFWLICDTFFVCFL